MKKIVFPFLTMLMLILMVACAPQESDKQANDALNSANADGQEVEEPAPMIDPEQFEKGTFGYFGLDLLQIGDSVTFAQLEVDVPVKDTLFLEASIEGADTIEYAWSVRRVEFEGGDVLLEADFEENTFLNRIRIETPEYRHFETGLGVGSTVKELAKSYPDLMVRPFPEYGVVELIPNEHNIYHIPMTDNIDPENHDTWELDKLDQAAKVMRVVIL